MAGDKNPWRDIYSDADWQTILGATTTYTPPAAAPAPAPAPVAVAIPVMGGHRPPRPPWRAAAPNPGLVLARLLGDLTTLIGQYHAVRKDDHNQFAQRIVFL